MTYLLNSESFQVAACLERKRHQFPGEVQHFLTLRIPLGCCWWLFRHGPPDQAEIITSTDKEHGLHGVNLPSETHNFSWGKSTISMATYPVRKTFNYIPEPTSLDVVARDLQDPESALAVAKIGYASRGWCRTTLLDMILRKQRIRCVAHM